MKRHCQRLLLLATALVLAILVILAVHEMIAYRIDGPPQRLVAALEVAVFVLMATPVLINEAIRIVHLLMQSARALPAREPLSWRYVLCLIAGICGSAGVYGTFLHFLKHDFPTS